MIRWLASLPALALFPLLAAIGIALTIVIDVVRRRVVAPETRERASATASVTLQATATIYAILIAFVIVDAYTQLRDAQEQISTKVSALSTLYENSRALPESEADAVRKATVGYARAVVDRALPRLEDTAEPELRTTRALGRLYARVQAIEPTTPSETVAYEAMVAGLNQIESTREQLINSARATIPPALFWLLVGIGLIVMCIASMLDTGHRRSHLFILSGLALVIWLTIALVLSMDYPFSGVIQVTDQPIREFLDVPIAR